MKKLFTNGKNIPMLYYTKSIILYLIPSLFFKYKMKNLINNVKNRDDYNYIIDRVNYYNKGIAKQTLPSSKLQLKDFRLENTKLKKHGYFGSRYFFDTYEYTKYFEKNLYFDYLFGDVILIPKTPKIVKSRPINDENQNSILLNLDKLRHFIFLDDIVPFEKKKNKAIFMGKIYGKANRVDFVQKFHNSSTVLCGDVYKLATQSRHKKLSLWAHLQYKFILTLEGVDVASNLKWVMSSSSIAVMPKPTYETWFMEGRLVANYHYIEIKSDYSDFEEKIKYYSEHIEESKQIIKNANEYIEQFKNKEQEKIISYIVLDKFLSAVN